MKTLQLSQRRHRDGSRSRKRFENEPEHKRNLRLARMREYSRLRRIRQKEERVLRNSLMYDTPPTEVAENDGSLFNYVPASPIICIPFEPDLPVQPIAGPSYSMSPGLPPSRRRNTPNNHLHPKFTYSNSQNNNLPQRPVRSKSLAKETRVDEVIPVVQFKELKSHLSSRNVNRMLELHKYILQIASMCYQLDFKGFAAAHIFDNMIKASFFTSEETETKTCVPLDQVGHVCECFIVNEHGKIGCGLYRVLVDILGEDIVYHLGLHSRPFSEVMMTFVNAAGFTILGQANLQLLMNIFSDVMSN